MVSTTGPLDRCVLGVETPRVETHSLQQIRNSTRLQLKRQRLRSRWKKANMETKRRFPGKRRPRRLFRHDSYDRRRKELTGLLFKYQGRKAVRLKSIDVDMLTRQRERQKKTEPTTSKTERTNVEKISIAHLAHRGRPPDGIKADGT